jgi:hypothetical protein
MAKYTKEFGSYYLKNETGEILLMTDQLSAVYDQDTFTLFKHGSPESCLSYAKKVNEKSCGIIAVVVTFPKSLDPERFNHMIHTSGSLKFLLEELQAEYLEQNGPVS